MRVPNSSLLLLLLLLLLFLLPPPLARCIPHWRMTIGAWRPRPRRAWQLTRVCMSPARLLSRRHPIPPPVLECPDGDDDDDDEQEQAAP